MSELYQIFSSTGNLIVDWALILVGIWVMVRFLVVPLRNYWRSHNSSRWCPTIFLPQLDKKLNKTVRVASRRNKTREYRLNLYRLSCSCKQRKYNLPLDIRRLCRHLRKELELSNLLLHYDDMVQCIIDHRVKDSCYKIISVRGYDVAVGFHPKSDFVRIYTRRMECHDPPGGVPSGHYDKFTLLLSQEVWIYGEAPPDAEFIIPAVVEMVSGYQKMCS
ncbi:MAG: hypothetical protein HQL78_09605 [Magnetococcales bacterium]|nr:hypothetical protein [Magnetococcales bacterium]